MTVKYEEVDVTPDMAKDMLERNLVNRTLKPGRAQRYANAMMSGNWPFVVDPIRVTEDYEILDGQHRLTAVMLSGCTVRMLIVSGIPREHQRFMDAGRVRTASDDIHMLGLKNSTIVGSTARLLLTITNEPAEGEEWDREVRVGAYSGKVTAVSRYEVVDYAEKHTNLEASAEIGMRASFGCRSQPTTLSLTHYMARRIDPYKADEFMSRLTSGTGLEEGNPIHAARETINRNRRDGARDGSVNLFLLLTAWNHWRSGKEISRLVLPVGGVVSTTIITMK